MKSYAFFAQPHGVRLKRKRLNRGAEDFNWGSGWNMVKYPFGTTDIEPFAILLNPLIT
jgi:hypothetical protein